MPLRVTRDCRNFYKLSLLGIRDTGGNGMSERDAVLAALRVALPELRRRFPIRSLGVFGSFARGDIAAESDVDVLVEFERPVGLSSFVALEDALRVAAGRPVD